MQIFVTKWEKIKKKKDKINLPVDGPHCGTYSSKETTNLALEIIKTVFKKTYKHSQFGRAEYGKEVQKTPNAS